MCYAKMTYIFCPAIVFFFYIRKVYTFYKCYSLFYVFLNIIHLYLILLAILKNIINNKFSFLFWRFSIYMDFHVYEKKA